MKDTIKKFPNLIKILDTKALLENHKVMRQIKRVEDCQVQKLLMKILQEITENTPQKSVFNIKKIFNQYFEGDYSQKIILLNNIDYLTEYFNQIMDLYLLARIFRTFETTGPSNLFNETNIPQRIIIHVGDKHAENYRLFLERLNFTMSFVVGTFPLSREVYFQAVKDEDSITVFKYVLYGTSIAHNDLIDMVTYEQYIVEQFLQYGDYEGLIRYHKGKNSMPYYIFIAYNHMPQPNQSKCLDITELNQKFFWSID